ncbi:hypothetical protein [Streptomyces sp. NPDC002328]|uniref:hypothetical protein n=1 Tax=Streptomyces sp. NPDC002328 TaxID=3364642 RepID=UPI0036C56CA4
MQMMPELTAPATVDTALDAADVAPATTSDSTYAAIADTGTNTVAVPWATTDAISVESTDRGSMTMAMPVAQPCGVALNGNVVYANPVGPVDAILVSSGTDESAVTHGLIDAPWARDANGYAVPASYRIENNASLTACRWPAWRPS